MAWRDRLLRASFKGITFYVDNSDYSGGRRTVLHQFANRDKPYLQDLGQEADEYIIVGHIVQNNDNQFDYFTERDNLIRVLKSKGSGILVHPFLGIKKVGQSSPFRMSETFSESGIARFTMSFRDAGERALPTALEDFLTAVDNRVNSAMDLVGDAFYIGYNTVASFQDLSQNAINRVIGSVQVAMTSLNGIATKVISESIGNINTIRNTITDVINSPESIFNAVKNCAYSLPIACGMGSVILNEQQSTSGFTSGDNLATNQRATDIYASKMTISTTVIGGETGSYSGITRGDVKELTADSIPETLGKSVVKSIIDTITDFDMTTFKNTPDPQQQNVALIIDIFKFCLIASICRVAIRINFKDQDEMITYMNDICDMIEDFLLYLGEEAADGAIANGIGTGTDPINNKDIFLAVEKIRDTFVNNMIKKASGITKTIEYLIPPDIQTTLQLAHSKYNDLSRADEIYKRNKDKIQHPGFMPGGDYIKILDA